MEHIPLHHEPSAGETNKEVRTSLPQEVIQCLENARFLHLATCLNNQPHLSLMSYTYLPSSPYSTMPVIIMTTNDASRKTTNIRANPNVSLLVHDWVSSRHLSTPRAQPSLATYLQNLNVAARSSTSATINGDADLLVPGGAAEVWYKQRHLENNSFGGGGGGVGLSPSQSQSHLAGSGASQDGAVDGDAPNPGREEAREVKDEEVRVIVVRIRDVRISDAKGHVWDWSLDPGWGHTNGSRD